MEFTGTSANYLRQQTEIALRALAPLQKLDPNSERQGLEAVIEACSSRLQRLPTDQPGSMVEAITRNDIGVLDEIIANSPKVGM